MMLVNLLTIALSLCFISHAGSLEIDAILQGDVDNLRKQVQEDILALMNNQFGWDHEETVRAVSALSLGNGTFFESGDMLSAVILKQLKLELAEALLKWHDEPLSAGRLALFINALVATCNDPHEFFGINLVSRLRHMATVSNYERALISLTLCIAGDRLSKNTIMHLSGFLNDTDEVHFPLDTQAMALIAISCANEHFQHTYIRPIVNEHLLSFKSKQKADGSFGNVYTTALVVQALIASGDNDGMWWFRHAFDYFKRQYGGLDEKLTLLSHYFVLPILNLKSLMHLKTTNCHSSSGPVVIQNGSEGNPQNELWLVDVDDDSSLSSNSSMDGENNFTAAITYSLWPHAPNEGLNSSLSTVVFIKDGETFLDVMERAAMSDVKFQFHAKQYSFGLLVESLAGMKNNNNDKLYWLLYQIEAPGSEPKMLSKGVTDIKPKDGDHYLFWYRSV